jgi:hypothetical protein
LLTIHPVLSHLRVLLGVIITMSAAFCTTYAKMQNQVPADVACRMRIECQVSKIFLHSPHGQSHRDATEREKGVSTVMPPLDHAMQPDPVLSRRDEETRNRTDKGAGT